MSGNVSKQVGLADCLGKQCFFSDGFEGLTNYIPTDKAGGCGKTCPGICSGRYTRPPEWKRYLGELPYAAWRWVWYGLNMAMDLMAQERMRDMTTVESGAHAHPEVDTMRDLMAQMVEGQTKMMSVITALAENQAKMQEAITTLAENQARMQESILELQAATGELARGMALLQADVTLLVARDDSRDDS